MATTRKTFQKDGRWIERLEKTEILRCSCGNKYLKTRAGQAQCLACLGRAMTEKERRRS